MNGRIRNRIARAFVGLLALALTAAPAAAQKKKPTDPTECPYCRNDPAKLQAAGLVSHGGFAFGASDTAKAQELLPECELRWIETKNFRLGFALGPWKVKLDEKKKWLAELTRLRAVLPEVKPETTQIDPWLRAHVYAQRLEDAHARFLELSGSKELTFPAAGTQWTIGATYLGEGPYLGMQDKYEVLVLPSVSASVTYLTSQCGVQSKRSQRWHYVTRGVLSFVTHPDQGSLRQDAGMHGHIVFNLAHNLYDGLAHYNYDTFVWLHEGLAHYMERELDPRYNSFDADEGAVAEETRKENWKPEVLKLIAEGEFPRMAELVGLKRYSELRLDHHFTTWSMVDFLIATKPDKLGEFMWALKRNFDAQGIPTGTKLPDLHRAKFKELFGWSYSEFDEAWKTWCTTAYKPGVPKGGDPNAGPGIPLPGG